MKSSLDALPPLAKIASGGMATVFVARDASGTLVAVKRPHPHLVEDRDFLTELAREAAIAARIDHPNVARVLGLRGEGEATLLVMTYVEGATLGELVGAAARGEAELTPRVALRVTLDACEGLHAVHELCGEDGAPLGLVHRDVSPQNLLVGRDGTTKVADFGLAKASLAKDASSTTGSLKGKLGYLAPEYVRGTKQDRRADVFALGVVLWEALAKKRLFRGASEAETLERVVHDDAPAISSVAPSLASLDVTLARALEKSPDRRFASMRELADALEAAARAHDLVGERAEVGAAIVTAFGSKLDARRREIAGAERSLRAPARRRAFVAVASAAGVATIAAIAFSMGSHGDAKTGFQPPVAVAPDRSSAIVASSSARAVETTPSVTASASASPSSTQTTAAPTSPVASPSGRSPRRGPEPPPNPYPR